MLEAITLQGLSQYTGGATPKQPSYGYEVPKMVPGVATSHMKFNDPLQFWSICSAAMNENPPPESEITAVVPQFKYLGLELGEQWKPENVNPVILAQMKSASEQIGDLALGTMPLGGVLQNGWIIPPANASRTGEMSRSILKSYPSRVSSDGGDFRNWHNSEVPSLTSNVRSG